VADRFDNLSVDQLQQALADARAEEKAIEAALAGRLEAACPVQVDGIYRVKAFPPLVSDSVSQVARYLLTYGAKLEGRIVQVCYIKAQRCGIGDDPPVQLRVSVRVKLASKRDTPTADGFGRKTHWIDPERLEPLADTP
jgi:hypothetical protein